MPSLRVVAGGDPRARRELDCLSVASDPTGRAVIYVPGTHLRCMDRLAALQLLLRIRSRIGMHGGALVGIDLLQRFETVDASRTVARRFSTSMLIRLNKELDGTFSEADLSPGTWFAEFGLQRPAYFRQLAAASGARLETSAGSSHSHSLVSLGILARRAHMEVAECWTDFDEQCELALLTPVGCPKSAPRV